MNKVHYLDVTEELKVPFWDQNKLNGYKMAKCGYQIKDATLEKDKVTCKHCLKLIG